MKKLLFAVAASSLALAACGERTDADDTTTTTADGTVVTSDNAGMVTDDQAAMNATPMNGDTATGGSDAQEYLRQAASSDLYEIQSSEMALQKSQNAAVRQFAQQMINDHRAATQKLQIAATGATLPAPDAGMLPAHRAKLDELREETGKDFDEKYVEQQREAHSDAIRLHEAMTRTENAPAALSGFAREALPSIQTHARMLETMKIDD